MSPVHRSITMGHISREVTSLVLSMTLLLLLCLPPFGYRKPSGSLPVCRRVRLARRGGRRAGTRPRRCTPHAPETDAASATPNRQNGGGIDHQPCGDSHISMTQATRKRHQDDHYGPSKSRPPSSSLATPPPHPPPLLPLLGYALTCPPESVMPRSPISVASPASSMATSSSRCVQRSTDS
jgi:hypothetical protein